MVMKRRTARESERNETRIGVAVAILIFDTLERYFHKNVTLLPVSTMLSTGTQRRKVRATAKPALTTKLDPQPNLK